MRLIDADTLKKTIAEEFHGISATGFIRFMHDKTSVEVYNRVRDLIDNAPTVEITEEQAIDKLHETGWLLRHDKEMTERPTGHWIKVTDCYCWHWECENCHSRPSRTSTGHDDLSNFCPNCGADMRKEEEND